MKNTHHTKPVCLSVLEVIGLYCKEAKKGFSILISGRWHSALSKTTHFTAILWTVLLHNKAASVNTEVPALVYWIELLTLDQRVAGSIPVNAWHFCPSARHQARKAIYNIFKRVVMLFSRRWRLTFCNLMKSLITQYGCVCKLSQSKGDALYVKYVV